jgi:predicted porin
VRQNQAITAKTENLSGFVLSAMYVNNNRDSTQYAAGSNTGVSQGGTTNSSGFGAGANFTMQKFYATAAYQSFKNETDNANAFASYPSATAFGSALPGDPARLIVGAGATTQGNGLGTVTQNGINITDNQTYGAATYDFGILKAYANYINRKATSTNNSAAFVKRSGQQLGVRSFITPTIEAWASAGNGRYSAYGVGAPTANFTAYQLGTNYLLSKRTNLYAIYGATQVSSTGAATNNSAGASSYGVGVRHTF